MADIVEFQRFKNLIAVVEAGTITLAAEHLHISQPALSKQMKVLEEELQVPLLVRHGKGVSATAAAEVLITGGRHLLKLRDDLISSARGMNNVKFPPMRLGFSSFVDHALLDMVCSIHSSLYPACEIKSESGDNVELLSMLEHGDIDAALLTLPVSGAGLKTIPFAQSRLVLCMRADDPLAIRKEIDPSELQAKLTIFREPKQHPEAHLELMQMLSKIGVEGDVASRYKTPHDLQWMVQMGYGYALIREGTELPAGLTTRPVAGVEWTVDSVLVLGRSTSQRTIPYLIRELKKRVHQLALKPVRSVRLSKRDKTLPLFG
jgi:LysR family hydrogen peroxide-inducible transcriptional activator